MTRLKTTKMETVAHYNKEYKSHLDKLEIAQIAFDYAPSKKTATRLAALNAIKFTKEQQLTPEAFIEMNENVESYHKEQLIEMQQLFNDVKLAQSLTR